MTAWLEMSRVHFGIKGGFRPVLVEQILLNCRYLSVLRTKTGAKVCVSSLSHHIPSEISGFAHKATSIQNNFYPVTDA